MTEGQTRPPEAEQVTLLLRSWSGGDKAALDQLVPMVYRELRRLAASSLKHERHGHTLQTTALVHEAYLKLVGQTQVDIRTRSHFLGIAANLMRQILVNHAKRREAAKRGGGNTMAMEEAIALIGRPHLDLVALDHALNKLAQLDPRQGRIVELRFFGGLTEEEISEVVGVSLSTVQRDWRTARTMLYKELRHGGLE
jgi:RNA polymerase sigma factor (TIGR02999 family)